MYLSNHFCYIDLQKIGKMNDSKRGQIPQLIKSCAAIEKVCNEENKDKQRKEDSEEVKLPTPFENIELSKLFNVEMRSKEGNSLTICYFKRLQDKGLKAVAFILKYLTLCEVIV